MKKKIKDILMLILIVVELVASCGFLIVYLGLPMDDPYKVIFFVLTIGMFFITFITIYAFGMTDKVKNVVKKVASVIFALTIGALIRVFDAFLNMATGARNSDLKVITGYEDKVFSVKQKKKKRRASYKSYRLMDNREKVRFLYYKAVTKAIRKGFFFKESDTPFEVNERLIKRKYYKDGQRCLSEMYNVCRYDEMSDITDEMVKEMKESC